MHKSGAARNDEAPERHHHLAELHQRTEGIHLAAYTAAKGGILSLTRLLAQQYGGYGIRANAICRGTIMTETSRVAYEAAPQLRDEPLRDVSG
jgi:NAD(P)-dependent dehydrogenase (short-subunit alcohol dehydrogenase family)